MSLDKFHEKAMQSYAESVARGEHDGQCEFPAHPYICHCSKRRREAEGHTTPPGDLIWQPPICPRCYKDTIGDGSGYACGPCGTGWDEHGMNATFIDDFGDDAFVTPSERSA